MAGPDGPARRGTWLSRPVGRGGTIALALVLVLVPAWLFADPLSHYRLHSDDFAYVAASRGLRRTLANLFEPHNTHVVPAWRLLTWAVVAAAGRLAELQDALAKAAYGILVAAMILMGRLVARETRSTAAGLVAMVAVGTTSVVESSATWYSSGQTFWAGFGILAMLWYLQGWRRHGGGWRLVAASVAAWAAGGFWTIGHMAGPVGAAYLWADGRPRCRKAAVVPLLATALAVAIGLGLGGRKINAKISFHGRTSREAVRFDRGVTHTLQAIPEDLVLANLGLVAETTTEQGAILTGAIAALWAAGLVRGRRWPNPLEAAGGVLGLGAYFVEWSFRGYLPYSSLRTVVPWYDTIPHLGAILFAAGWWSGGRSPGTRTPLTWAEAAGVVALQFGLVAVHQGRVEALFVRGVPKMSAAEAELYRTPELQRLRAVALADEFARWQRRHLAKLDQAEAVARRLGIGREAIHRAFGRVDAPELPPVYDAAAMLDLPWRGSEDDPGRVRAALGRYFEKEPEPILPVPEGLRVRR